MVNDGINTGIVGNVHAGNLVVGDNAKIEVNSIEQPVMDRLQALAWAIESYEGSPDTRIEMVAAHREVVDELNAVRPDKNRILARLSDLTRVAGSATTVAGAVTALVSAIQLVL